MSELKGPNRALLDTYLEGTHATVSTIADASLDWHNSAALLRSIAHSLTLHTTTLDSAFGADSEVTAAATAAFQKAADTMTSRADQLEAGSHQLTTVHAQLIVAQSEQKRLTPPTDAGTAPTVTDPSDPAQKKKYNAWKAKSDAAGKAYNDNETAAAAQIRALDTAFDDAALTMREIHGETPAPPPSSGGAGPGMPSGTTGGGRTSGRQSATKDPTTVVPTATVVATDPGTTHHPGATATTSTTGTSTTGTGGDQGGLLQGGGTPMPSAPTSTPVTPSAPVASSGGLSAGGIASGVGGAGVLGAGALGGLGGYGAGGAGAGSLPPLRFEPGQTIGGSAASRVGGGALGAEEQAVAGRRTVAAGGGVGSGARGAAGGRGAAGSRGGGSRTGAAAGGRGRDRKRGEQAADDLWDDGSDWLDDEGAGPAVVR